MTNKKVSVGIIGGGISGLSVAYALQKKGISAVVYEQADTTGGSISSVQSEGWLVEEGPNTLMIKSQAVWDLLDELGLHSRLLEANAAAQKRFVVKDRTPQALPNSTGSFLKTPLFSAGAKLRLLKEPFVAPSQRHDESIASFIRRRLGRQPLDYAVNPFVSGIFAGDPQKLSMKHTFSSLWQMEQQHGSLLKGLFKKERPESQAKRALISFREGNQSLPKALAAALEIPVRTGVKIISAEREGNHWQVKGRKGEEPVAGEHDCLISAVPARAAAGIFGSEPFNKLRDLPYAPIQIIALGFAKEQIAHPLDGFGMLIPEAEGFKTLGVLFSSTLFPGRAPQGHHLLTCFIGGARHPRWAQKPLEQVKDHLMEELETLLGVRGKPVFQHRRCWPQAIPQYEVGYDYYLSLMKDIEGGREGLYLEGNFRGGVSVPDCIASGFETAQKAHAYLRSKSDS